MINKQSLWFLTLFSIILVLSVYYVAMPNNTLATIKENDTEVQTININNSDALAALRVQNDEEIESTMQELQSILLNEKTTLEENSVDVITVAQAFHWFDKEQCRIEFKRILKENGYVVTVWNSLEEDSAFIKEYVEIIHRYEIKMTAGNLYFNPDEEKLKFLGQDFVKAYFDNYQTATLEALISNVSSISYMPSKSDDRYTEMVEELTHLFNKYQQNGTVTFHYKTEVCIGQFAS